MFIIALYQIFSLFFVFSQTIFSGIMTQNLPLCCSQKLFLFPLNGSISMYLNFVYMYTHICTYIQLKAVPGQAEDSE